MKAMEMLIPICSIDWPTPLTGGMVSTSGRAARSRRGPFGLTARECDAVASGELPQTAGEVGKLGKVRGDPGRWPRPVGESN